MPLKGGDAVKKAMAKTKREANTKIKGVYISGLQLIVSATPADTGRARNNWFLSVGTPFSLFGRDENKQGSGSDASIDTMPSWVLNKRLFFTNNLPYLVGLENGTSKQAPDGWVKKALIKMQQKIRSL